MCIMARKSSLSIAATMERWKYAAVTRSPVRNSVGKRVSYAILPSFLVTELFSAESLIISPGGTPRLPPALASHWPSSRVFHSSSYIPSADAFFASAVRNSVPLRIAVIGAGQSATEVLLDIRTRLNALPVAGGQKHALEMIFRKGSLKPSDDTPFSNEIFDPACMS